MADDVRASAYDEYVAEDVDAGAAGPEDAAAGGAAGAAGGAESAPASGAGAGDGAAGGASASGAAGAAGSAGADAAGGAGAGGASAPKVETKASFTDKIVKTMADSTFGVKVSPDKALAKAIKSNALLTDIKSGKLDALGAKLNDQISSFAGKGMDMLIKAGGETWAFLQQAAGTFINGLLDKILGALLSHVYIPEMIFLPAIMALYLVKSNPTYKNDYLRKVAMKRDLAMTLKWLDGVTGKTYSNINGRGTGTAVTAGRSGCCKIARYIMDELYAEYKEVLRIRVFPTVEDPIGFPLSKSEADAIDKIAANWNKNKHSITKSIIVGSYSNFVLSAPGTVLTYLTVLVGIKEIISDYDIHPSAFGSNDKEFGKSFMISKSDINVIAPFYKPKKTIQKTTAKIDPKTKQTVYKIDGDPVSKPQYDAAVAQNKGSGSLLKEIGSINTTLVNNIDTPKFIAPKNFNIKKIYVYLADKSKFGDYYMYNKPLYERLKYLIYDTAISTMDSALSGLFNTGFGAMFMSGLNTLESAIYEYVRSVERYLYDPAKVQYISVNDLVKLPEPDEPPPTETPKKPGGIVRVNPEQVFFIPGGKDSNLEILPGETTKFDVYLYPNNTTEQRVDFTIGEYDTDNYHGKLKVTFKGLKNPEKVTKTVEIVTKGITETGTTTNYSKLLDFNSKSNVKDLIVTKSDKKEPLDLLKIGTVYVTATNDDTIVGDETIGVIGRCNVDSVVTFTNITILKPENVPIEELRLDLLPPDYKIRIPYKGVGGVIVTKIPKRSNDKMSFYAFDPKKLALKWDSSNCIAVQCKMQNDTDYVGIRVESGNITTAFMVTTKSEKELSDEEKKAQEEYEKKKAEMEAYKKEEEPVTDEEMEEISKDIDINSEETEPNTSGERRKWHERKKRHDGEICNRHKRPKKRDKDHKNETDNEYRDRLKKHTKDVKNEQGKWEINNKAPPKYSTKEYDKWYDKKKEKLDEWEMINKEPIKGEVGYETESDTNFNNRKDNWDKDYENKSKEYDNQSPPPSLPNDKWFTDKNAFIDQWLLDHPKPSKGEPGHVGESDADYEQRINDWIAEFNKATAIWELLNPKPAESIIDDHSAWLLDKQTILDQWIKDHPKPIKGEAGHVGETEQQYKDRLNKWLEEYKAIEAIWEMENRDPSGSDGENAAHNDWNEAKDAFIDQWIKDHPKPVKGESDHTGESDADYANRLEKWLKDFKKAEALWELEHPEPPSVYIPSIYTKWEEDKAKFLDQWIKDHPKPVKGDTNHIGESDTEYAIRLNAWLEAYKDAEITWLNSNPVPNTKKDDTYYNWYNDKTAFLNQWLIDNPKPSKGEPGHEGESDADYVNRLNMWLEEYEAALAAWTLNNPEPIAHNSIPDEYYNWYNDKNDFLDQWIKDHPKPIKGETGYTSETEQQYQDRLNKWLEEYKAIEAAWLLDNPEPPKISIPGAYTDWYNDKMAFINQWIIDNPKPIKGETGHVGESDADYAARLAEWIEKYTNELMKWELDNPEPYILDQSNPVYDVWYNDYLSFINQWLIDNPKPNKGESGHGGESEQEYQDRLSEWLDSYNSALATWLAENAEPPKYITEDYKDWYISYLDFIDQYEKDHPKPIKGETGHETETNDDYKSRLDQWLEEFNNAKEKWLLDHPEPPMINTPEYIAYMEDKRDSIEEWLKNHPEPHFGEIGYENESIDDFDDRFNRWLAEYKAFLEEYEKNHKIPNVPKTNDLPDEASKGDLDIDDPLLKEQVEQELANGVYLPVIEFEYR
jgi:broad specificity phosphatase PhoE